MRERKPYHYRLMTLEGSGRRIWSNSRNYRNREEWERKEIELKLRGGGKKKIWRPWMRRLERNRMHSRKRNRRRMIFRNWQMNWVFERKWNSNSQREDSSEMHSERRFQGLCSILLRNYILAFPTLLFQRTQQGCLRIVIGLHRHHSEIVLHSLRYHLEKPRVLLNQSLKFQDQDL